jgi:hypothetical protein
MRKILFLLLGVCLLLFISDLHAMECQIVDEEGNAINSVNAGELVYFKSTYAYSKSKKMAWNLMVTLPSVDLKNYKTSMKHNGYFFHEGSLENKSRLIPIVIPNDTFIEGNATFKYTLTSNGNCYAYLNIQGAPPPPPYNSPIVGQWVMIADWQCDKRNDAWAIWTFNSDGSLSSSTGNVGEWSLQNNEVTVVMNTSSYYGNVASDGTISGAIGVGCWSAWKNSETKLKSWIFSVDEGSTSYQVFLDLNANRTFEIKFKPLTGNPNICYISYAFLQGNSQFDLSPYASDSDSALLASLSGWDGCSYVYQGQTVTSMIVDLPAWFNPSSTFSVGLRGDFLVLEPDGSVHR